MRGPRDFWKRAAWEREWLLQNTWCDVCQEADLGMVEPVEYEEGEAVYVEGKCAICAGPVKTHLSTR